MRHNGLVAVSLLLGLVIRAGSPATADPATQTPLPSYFKTGILDFESRVWAQTQIERVYYNHRIWPRENSGPKPVFDERDIQGIIHAKVSDILQKQNALVSCWKIVIRPDQLQHELNRMFRESQDREILKELFAALHADPRLIANTLAFNSVVSHLLTESVVRDRSLQADCQSRIAALWQDADSGAPMSAAIQRTTAPNEDRLGADTFNRDHGLMAKAPDTLPVRDGTWSPVIESDIDFLFHRVISTTEAGRVTEEVRIAKPAAAAWWSQNRSAFSPDIAPVIFPGDYRFSMPDANVTSTCVGWDNPISFNGAPYARLYHTAVWTGTEMIVWGGFIGSNLRSDGGRYDPVTDTWDVLPAAPAALTGRFWHSAVWTGTEMIIWGGSYGGNSGYSNGARFNPATNVWTMLSETGSTPSPRSLHTAIWSGSVMVIWGGRIAIVNGAATLGDGAIYNPNSDSWTTMSSAGAPSPRDLHTAVWSGTEMIVWGGSAIVDSPSPLDTGARFRPDTNTWAPVSAAGVAPFGRYAHSAVWSGSRMIISGGSFFSPSTAAALYDPVADLWTVSSQDPIATSDTSQLAVWTGAEMIMENTGHTYRPGTDQWRVISAQNAPSVRHAQTTVWSGTEMLVWGGSNFSAIAVKGGRYDPVSDSWSAIVQDKGQPSKRASHSAIWTGVEMIIWGGYLQDGSNEPVFNDGARYFPATHAWEPIAVDSGTPSRREGHTAIWTGTSMIVWGGDDRTYPAPSSGGEYNPLLDAWTPTALDGNTPPGGLYHTAVWSGQEMLVFGGSSGTNSVGRYNPGTRTWSISAGLPNAPSPRDFHSAVWTGREMIVWGGSYGNSFNDGGIFNPATNTWRQMSLAGAAEKRSGHVAVWTGTEMIVWGGTSGVSTFGTETGGRYDLASNSWRPMAPSDYYYFARADATGIWTGSEMVAFGGGYNGYEDGLVGIYRPSDDSWSYHYDPSRMPEGRYQHSMIWTGRQAIVWGGRGAYFYMDGDALDLSTITVQPADVAGCINSTASFTVAHNDAAATYRWRKNGVALSDDGHFSGTGTNTLLIGNAGLPDEGLYDVAVGGQCGGTSRIAQLVIQRPLFQGIASAANGATNSCSTLLSWNPATMLCPGGFAYNVYRSTNPAFPAGPSSRIAAGISATSYADHAGLANGITYYYQVHAVESHGLEDLNMVKPGVTPYGALVMGNQTENFEGTFSGGGFDNAGWSHAAVSGTKDWAWSAAQSKSPTHSWWSQSLASASDRVLTSPAYKMTATSTLTFWHTYYFDYNISLDICKDGGTLEITTNGGSSWSVLPGAAFTAGGFDGAIGSTANPLNGKSAWCSGAIGPMTQVNVNLSAYNGQTVQIRWHAGDDGAVAKTGWYVDSVTFNNVQISSACTTCNVTAMSAMRGAKSGADLQVNWPGVAGAAAYNIYRSSLGPNPYTWGSPAGSAGSGAISWLDAGQLSTTGSRFYTVTDTNSCGAESPR